MSQTFQAKRFKQLVVELGHAHDYKRGWKAQVAQKLGVSASYVSKTLKNDIKDVGGETIEKAMEATGLDGSFFFDADERQLSTRHTEYLTARIEERRRLAENRAEASLKMNRNTGRLYTRLPKGMPNSAQWAEVGRRIATVMESLSIRPTDDPKHTQTTIKIDAAKDLATSVLQLRLYRLAVSLYQEADGLTDSQLAGTALALAAEAQTMYVLMMHGMAEPETEPDLLAGAFIRTEIDSKLD